jgi:mannitol/fructose-specific phosphotransferase system IIA component (Ntr-type)
MGMVLYDERHILSPLVAADREELFRLLARALAERDDMDEKRIWEGISAREAMMSTLVAPGIALPHTQFEGLGRTTGILAVIPGGCDYGGGNRVTLAALVVDDLLLPSAHQDTLRRFGLMAKNPRFLEKVAAAATPARVCSVIKRLEMTA